MGIYVLGNVLYGFWVVSFGNIADPVTQFITYNTEWLLNLVGIKATIFIAGIAPNLSLQLNGKTVINVYEGCNAINVSILFIAFLFAYSGPIKKTIWFSMVGLIAIYVFNLMRLIGLFLIAVYNPENFYFTHRFAFTGVIYAFVFALWFIWVVKVNPALPAERHKEHREDTKGSEETSL